MKNKWNWDYITTKTKWGSCVAEIYVPGPVPDRGGSSDGLESFQVFFTYEKWVNQFMDCKFSRTLFIHIDNVDNLVEFMQFAYPNTKFSFVRINSTDICYDNLLVLQ